MQIPSVKAFRQLAEKAVNISSYPQEPGKLCDEGQAFKLVVKISLLPQVWCTIYVKLYTNLELCMSNNIFPTHLHPQNLWWFAEFLSSQSFPNGHRVIDSVNLVQVSFFMRNKQRKRTCISGFSGKFMSAVWFCHSDLSEFCW